MKLPLHEFLFVEAAVSLKEQGRNKAERVNLKCRFLYE